MPQTFLLVDAGEPAQCYCLGLAADDRATTVHLNPRTGEPVFGSYCSMDEARQQIGGLLANCAVLALRLLEPDVPEYVEGLHEEIVLEKAVARESLTVVQSFSWRPGKLAR